MSYIWKHIICIIILYLSSAFNFPKWIANYQTISYYQYKYTLLTCLIEPSVYWFDSATCPMHPTHSPVDFFFGASFIITSRATVPSTNSSYQCIFGTSFMTASLSFGCKLCPMPLTHSSFLCIIGTSLMATDIPLGTMSSTYSSIPYLIGASLMATSLLIRPVPLTNSSLPC